MRSFSSLSRIALSLVLLAGCERTVKTNALPHALQTFRVNVTRVSTATADKTGVDEAHALDLPPSPVELDVEVTALDERGHPFADFKNPVSFRVTPGRILDVQFGGFSTGNKMLPMDGGHAVGRIIVDKVFGSTQLWAQDSAPPPEFTIPTDTTDSAPTDAGTIPDDAGAADPYERSFAAGLSAPIYFAKPTIADVQRVLPDATNRYDNRGSPLAGNFLTINAARPEDPKEVPGPRADMIVTALTPDGFFVTDKLAKNADGLPGTFGHMFVYNYQYPDGLYLGDRVSSLTGTVTDFSGSTQMVFPSWVRVEGNPRPQDIPAPAVFDFGSPQGLGYTLCKVRAGRPADLDVLCGYSNNNGAMETYESALVKLVNVKPSNTFAVCDLNGNGNVPPFSYVVPDLPDGSGPDFDHAHWGCYDNGADTVDCECNRDCVTSQGIYSGKVCSEASNLKTYGQWVVMLEPNSKTRINVQTRDALPDFDPKVFATVGDDGKLKYDQCTLDITGMLRQVQAARPRWLVLARDEQDVCIRCPDTVTPPAHIPVCPKASQ